MRVNGKLFSGSRVVAVSSLAAGLGIWISLSTPWPGFSEPLVDALRLPSPTSVVQTFMTHTDVFLAGAVSTFARVLIGLACGIVLGVGLALTMIRWPLIYSAVDPYLECLRPIPPFGLIPFLILWWGLSVTGQLVIISLGAFMVMVVSTIVAVDTVERRYINAVRSLGADSRTVFRMVVIPAIAPALISATRVAAGTATGLATAAEYLGAQSGLGFIVRNARVTLSTESILLSLMLLGLGSAILDQLIRLVGRRMTRWLDRPLGTN